MVGNPVLGKCPRCKGDGRNPIAPSVQMCPVCQGIARLTESGIPPTVVRPEQALETRGGDAPGKLPFVAESRIEELRASKHAELDLKKLVRLCEELNVAYNRQCYFAVIMLTRSILDHVPPVFGKSRFGEVANNYGGQSFKDAMRHLDEAARKIADAHLHGPMRKSEVLPVTQQVHFVPQIDMLLAEIVRITR